MGAGVGEHVFFVRGKEASFPFCPPSRPSTRASSASSITGIWGERMQIGRVIGTLVATQKHRKLEGAKLLLVQPLTLDGQPRGVPVLTIDSVGAGVGERC